MAESEIDQEVAAIGACMHALSPLNDDSRRAVVSYLITRLDLKIAHPTKGDGHGPPSTEEEQSQKQTQTKTPTPPPPKRRKHTDIRSLKEEKQPASDVEMAALAAYYQSEVAPAEERRESITMTEFKQLCKEAAYPVPDSAHTLKNAKKAGYLKSTSERGRYALSTVGYNLIAHKLPREQ